MNNYWLTLDKEIEDTKIALKAYIEWSSTIIELNSAIDETKVPKHPLRYIVADFRTTRINTAKGDNQLLQDYWLERIC